MSNEHDDSKRRFLKTAAYVAPVIMTLNVTPSLATIGSYDRKTYSSDKSDFSKSDLKSFGNNGEAFGNNDKAFGNSDHGWNKNDGKQFDLFGNNGKWNNDQHGP